MRKRMAQLLVLTLLMTCMPIGEVYGQETFDHSSYTELMVKQVMAEHDLYNLQEPSRSLYQPWILHKNQKLYFNVVLFLDQSLPVYGTCDDVKRLEGKNDFKIVDEGYYQNKSYLGEYRVHGYTSDGRLYYNNDFPRDSDSGRTVSEKQWIYHYWKEIDNIEASQITKNSVDPNFIKRVELRSAIDDLVDDVLTYSTNSSGAKDHENQGHAVADHMNVNQISSSRFNGEGTMMQENGGRLWYQVFSTNKTQGKEKKEQEIQVNILNKDSYQFNQDGKQVIQVEVTGIYQDGDITSDSDKLIFYHREDIKSIHLKLTIGNRFITFSSKPNNQVAGHSALTHVFELEIDEGDIHDNSFTGKGESYTTFYSSSSESRNDSAYGQDMAIIAGGLKSMFDIKDIDLSNQQFKKDMIVYQDYSVGDIHTYKMTVVNQSTKEEVDFVYGSSPDGFVDDLYNYLKGNDSLTSYRVIQTVISDYDEDTFVDTFSFRKEIKKALELDFEIPDDVIDVDRVLAADLTDYSSAQVTSREIRINGEVIDWDAFFGGNYFFKPTNSNYLALIEIKVISDDVESVYRDAIHVHSSLPRTKLIAEGHFKENRKITLFNRSKDIEDPFVSAKYPSTYEISYEVVEGHLDDWKRKSKSDNEIDMLFKAAGFYKVTIKATNGTGRYSSTDYHIGITPDYEPNVIFNIWNNVLTRNEPLEVTYEAESLDGDIISSNQFNIYFDEDEDGDAELLVYEGQTLNYTPTELGYYKVVNELVETYGEPTIDEFISSEDRRIKRVERIFYVDNLRPLVEIDLDVPENFQKVDMYIMSDENYPMEKITKLRENRIDYNNALRLYGLDAQVKYRDLRTYISTQEVDTSYYFGSSYPTSTYLFQSGGFSGVLSQYNVTDNSYEDYYTTSESYEHCETVNVFNGYVNCDTSCLSSCNFLNWHGCDRSCCDKDYTQKVACETRYEDVRHYYTVHRYTGYYKGEASKSFKQPYTNPFRETSDKYVVYIADDTFNLSDYYNMLDKGHFKTILVGPADLKEAVDDEIIFMENSEDVMDKVVQFIGKQYPYSANYVVEVGSPFEIYKSTFDTENDLITDYGFQYVQDLIFDNSVGREEFAKETLNDIYTDYQATSFSKVGLYTIYSSLKDDTKRASFNKYSNMAEVSVLVHRKPIADYMLDWHYDVDISSYQITFQDRSYDLDHQYSHPTKGIVDIKGMYRKEGDSQWIYAIPDVLKAGAYEFRYSVKDLEGAWSHPKMMTFTLYDVPPPQLLDGQLRVKNQKFMLSNIPSTELLEFYDIRTRYPLDYEIGYVWLNKGQKITKPVLIDSNYIILEKDRFYEPYTFNIPKEFSDGTYQLQLFVRDKNKLTLEDTKNFDVTVVTPIELNGHTPENILPGENVFKATTSKYVDEVYVTLYVGTPYEETHQMMLEDEWTYVYDASDIVPDGTYDIRYEAVILSDPKKKEHIVNQTEKISLKATSIRVTGDWQYWKGGKNIFGESLSDDPNRFMSLEAIDIEVESIGKPDRIEITMSPELMSMSYVDEKNNVYYYKDMIGKVVEFPLLMSSENEKNWHVSYVLPLADSTLSVENIRLRNPYIIHVILVKGTTKIPYEVMIDLTGNTLDRVYIQPNE